MAAERIPKNTYRIWKPIMATLPGAPAYRVHRTISGPKMGGWTIQQFMEDGQKTGVYEGDVLQFVDHQGISHYHVGRWQQDTPVSRINADDVEEGAARFEELPR